MGEAEKQWCAHCGEWTDHKSGRHYPKFLPGQAVYTWFNSGMVRVVITKHRIIAVAANPEHTGRDDLPFYQGQSAFGYRVEPTIGSGGWIDQAWFRDSHIGAAVAGGA